MQVRVAAPSINKGKSAHNVTGNRGSVRVSPAQSGQLLTLMKTDVYRCIICSTSTLLDKRKAIDSESLESLLYLSTQGLTNNRKLVVNKVPGDQKRAALAYLIAVDEYIISSTEIIDPSHLVRPNGCLPVDSVLS